MSISTLEVTNLVPIVEACRICGASDRYASGACKACRKLYTASNKDRQKSNDAARYIKKRDQLLAASAAWNVANKERVKIRDAARYRENSAKINAYCAKWRAENQEKVIARRRSWDDANRERINAAKRAWYGKNAERLRLARAVWVSMNGDIKRAQEANWRAKNRDLCIIKNHRQRAFRKGAVGTLTRGLSKKLFALQRGKCACCKQPLGDKYHMDHINPLALGGSNTDDNIQLLRQTCNQQKGMIDPVVFMQKRGFLL